VQHIIWLLTYQLLPEGHRRAAGKVEVVLGPGGSVAQFIL
jgi:hypothetical protein